MPAYVTLHPDPINPALRKFRLQLIQRLQLTGYDVHVWTMRRDREKEYLVIQADGPQQAKSADHKVIFFYTQTGTDPSGIPQDEIDDFVLYCCRAQRIRPEWHSTGYLMLHDPATDKTQGRPIAEYKAWEDVTDHLEGIY